MKCAPLAQLVEHLTLNQGVRGSSPRRRISLETSVSGLFLCPSLNNFSHQEMSTLSRCDMEVLVAIICCAKCKYPRVVSTFSCPISNIRE